MEFEVKITGSGTLAEIVAALKSLAEIIENDAPYADYEGEGEVLFIELTKKEPEGDEI